MQLDNELTIRGVAVGIAQLRRNYQVCKLGLANVLKDDRQDSEIFKTRFNHSAVDSGQESISK